MLLLAAAPEAAGRAARTRVRSPSARRYAGGVERRERRAPASAGPAEQGRAGPAVAGPPTRRQLLRGAGAAASLGVLGALGTGAVAAGRSTWSTVDPRTEIPLYAGTVAHDASGERVLVGGRAPDLALTPGTRLAATLSEGSPVRERAADFAARTAPWRDRLRERLEADDRTGTLGADGAEDGAGGGADRLCDLADSALADLWVLDDELPAPVAGWTANWRYVWPRDAAFCAVALARIGAVERAVEVLAHFQELQQADGWFEARYVPGTDRAPDRRAPQFDGTGLLLWASGEVVTAAGPSGGAIADRLAQLVTTSLSALHHGTAGGTALPPASPDYWEVTERSTTLWGMGAALAGLRAGAAITGTAGAADSADVFAHLFAQTFGRGGYQRYRDGGGADSALALFDATGGRGIVEPERLLALRHQLARPGGGIAPGAAWKEDGVSWTPSTSLLGLGLARAGERRAAREVLAWLAEHRTEEGSLPEKVLHDGRPAQVAPLAWTAANTLLALDALAG